MKGEENESLNAKKNHIFKKKSLTSRDWKRMELLEKYKKPQSTDIKFLKTLKYNFLKITLKYVTQRQISWCIICISPKFSGIRQYVQRRNMWKFNQKRRYYARKIKVKITLVNIFQTDWLIKTKNPTTTPFYQMLFKFNMLKICDAKQQDVPPGYVLYLPGFTWDKFQI